MAFEQLHGPVYYNNFDHQSRAEQRHSRCEDHGSLLKMGNQSYLVGWLPDPGLQVPPPTPTCQIPQSDYSMPPLNLNVTWGSGPGSRRDGPTLAPVPAG